MVMSVFNGLRGMLEHSRRGPSGDSVSAVE